MPEEIRWTPALTTTTMWRSSSWNYGAHMFADKVGVRSVYQEENVASVGTLSTQSQRVLRPNGRSF
jgi:hypothetical protein